MKPGAYPWGNHHNAWRPNHIHFSVFGHSFLSRLVTQMYFPGDPLLPHDPIFNCTADVTARERLISSFDWETTLPSFALGFTASDSTRTDASACLAQATRAGSRTGRSDV